MRKLFGLMVLCGMLSACGAAGQQLSAGSGTGSVAFKLVLAGQQKAKPGQVSASSFQAPTLDCAATGISTISADVMSGSTVVASGGPWACSLGQGSISNVTAGSGYSIAISGKDSGGTVVYSGTQPGITVTSGATANAGTIALASTGFVSVAGTVSSATSGKPAMGNTAPRQAAVSSATVKAIGPDGLEAASTTTDASGGYTLKLATHKNYVIRIAYGSCVMKAVAKVDAVPLTPATTPVNVNPTTTAVTMLFAEALKASNPALDVTTFGETGTSFATEIAAVDVSSALAQLTSNANTATLAASVGSAAQTGKNPFTEIPPTAVSTYVAGYSLPVKAVDAPTGVTATAGSGKITLNWTAVAGAASYNIYYGISSGLNTANGSRIAGATSGGAVSNLTNGSTYYFIVTSVNAAGESAASAMVSATPRVPVPDAPSTVTVAANNGGVTVSWSAVSGASSYNVYYGTSPGVTTANGSRLAGVISGVTVGNLSNGTAYYFLVTAVNTTGEGTAFSAVSATPQITAPNTPVGISITGGNGQATLNWTAVTGAASYNVYYGTSAGISTTSYTTKVTGATSGQAITGLTNGTAYYFIVTAVNAGGESTASTAVSATPATAVAGAPTGVAVSAGNAQATVSWTPVPGATSYNVYYATTLAGATTASTSKVIGATSGVAVTGLTNGTTYYFIVTAATGGSESAASAAASATPQVAAPSTPTGVTATAGNTAVTPSWTAVSGATSYNVYYSTASGVTAATGIKVTGATSGGAISGLTNGTAYYFIVTAVNAGGESSASSVTSATPVSGVSAAPTGVLASAGNAQATLSWTAVAGATSYNAYYGTASGVTTSTGTKITGAVSGNLITGLANGTAYYFIVTAVSTAGEGAASSEVSATPVSLMGGAVQNGGVALGNQSTGATVTTLAGSAGVSGSANGTGNAAQFFNSRGITTDGTNLYVADSNNHVIRKVVIATGVVTTLAGSPGIMGHADGTSLAARFFGPQGIATDGTNLYVAQWTHTIRKIIIATGEVTTLAGSPELSGSLDGIGTTARFNNPSGITTDGTFLYVADNGNHTIRKVVIATGAVTTLAGSAGMSGSTDGIGSAARFYQLNGITMDGASLYIADSANSTIRKIVIATGVVTTIAGSAGVAGSNDGAGVTARLNYPYGITTDGTNLYVADNNCTIRKVVIATGVVTTLAGSASVVGSSDGAGVAARFWTPYGIITEGNNLYVADANNNNIRKISATTAPSAPTGVTASAGNAQVSVNWTASSGATSYNVYYSTFSNVTTATGVKVTGATSGQAITGLTNGLTYYFLVTAVNAGGESSPASAVSATPQVPAPTAPTGVTVSAGNAQAAVSWSAVTGATSYNVYYATTVGGATTASTSKVVGATSGSTITGLTNGTTYYFIVTAVNAGGESVASGAVSATPQVPATGAPTGVSASAGNAQATVSWTAVTGATSYNVYYGTSAVITTSTGTKVPGATSGGAITGLTNGTTYFFIVTAVNAGGESGASSATSATPQVPVPSAPTSPSATSGNAQVTVDWTAVTGATSYNVYYGTSAVITTSTGTKVPGGAGGVITGLTNGTTYFFIVTAVNAGGESAASGTVSATPQTPAPSVPTGVSLTAGNAQIAISWTAVTGATSYNVYYATTLAGATTSSTSKVIGAASGGAVTGLTNGTTYYFVVTALNAGGEGTASAAVSGTPAFANCTWDYDVWDNGCLWGQ